MSFTKLTHLLPRQINRLQLTQAFQATQICHTAKELLKRKFGEEILLHVQPKSFQDGVLTFSVAHAGWGQELHMISHWLRSELNKFHQVKRIRVDIHGRKNTIT